MSPKPAPTETILGQANLKRRWLVCSCALSFEAGTFLAMLHIRDRSLSPNDLVISSGEGVRPDFRRDQMNEKDDEITHPGMVANPKKTVIFDSFQ